MHESEAPPQAGFRAVDAPLVLATLWIFTKVHQGRNWARIMLLVLALLFALLGLSSAFRNSFMQIVSAAPPVAKVHIFISLGMNIAILWLLFTSQAKSGSGERQRGLLRAPPLPR